MRTGFRRINVVPLLPGNHWLKIKNPAAPAARREAEEDWGAKRWARGRRPLKTPRSGTSPSSTAKKSQASASSQIACSTRSLALGRVSQAAAGGSDIAPLASSVRHRVGNEPCCDEGELHASKVGFK